MLVFISVIGKQGSMITLAESQKAFSLVLRFRHT